jgi:hypothetical protein
MNQMHSVIQMITTGTPQAEHICFVIEISECGPVILCLLGHADQPLANCSYPGTIPCMD